MQARCRLLWSCTSPKSYAGLAGNGSQTGTAHTFQVRAMNAGGTDPSPAAYTWTIDTVKPAANVTGPPPDPSGGENVAFAFAANEPSTFQCSLAGPDPSAVAPCASGVAYSDLADGDYTFTVAPTDQAGNVGDPATYSWEVDNSIDEPPPPTPDTSIGTKPPAVTKGTIGRIRLQRHPCDRGGIRMQARRGGVRRLHSSRGLPRSRRRRRARPGPRTPSGSGQKRRRDRPQPGVLRLDDRHRGADAEPDREAGGPQLRR